MAGHLSPYVSLPAFEWDSKCNFFYYLFLNFMWAMQLEEFERAVRSSYVRSSNDDSKDRHREFIVAIEDQVSKIENSLQECSASEGKPSHPWVRLDEGECNELALFLSGPSTSQDKTPVESHGRDNANPQVSDKESASYCSKSSNHSAEWGSQDTREEKSQGHRRTASASADIGAWKISVFDDSYLPICNKGQPNQPVRKIPSFSGFLNSMESASKLKWSRNGFRKWKAVDSNQEADNTLLRSAQLNKVCFHLTSVMPKPYVKLLMTVIIMFT